jgi:methionyl-tRNA formyltransferase
MTNKYKIIFMGTPEFAVAALTEIIKDGYEVIAVYTQPPRPSGRGMAENLSAIHTTALKYNIPVFTPKSLKNEADQQQFIKLKADFAVVAAYGLLLPKPILDSCRCINIHASILPRWRGAAPLQRSIMAGDKKTGICIMIMDEGLDTGDVMLTKEIPILPDMTGGHLHDALSGIGAKLIVQSLHDLQNNTAIFTKQQGEATYAAKINKQEAKINWNSAGEQILLNIRAFNPYPGAYFEYNNEKIKIFEADFTRNIDAREPGTVLDKNFTISCKNGIIQPLLVQRQGKKIMPIAEFLNGFSLNI